MKRLYLLIRELREFYRFFRTNKHEREIVFYVEDTEYYIFFEGLIGYLTNNYNLKICYVTSDPADPLLSKKKININPFYIKHLLGFFTLFLDSKLLLMTMPDLHRFHIKRSIRGANHAYFFHNIGSYFHVTRYGGTFHYDTIFCVGPHHIKELRREEELYNLPPRKLVKFGYYRLERIYNEFQKREHIANRNGKYKAKILVAPGWGPWEERNSMLDLCGSKLIRILLQSNYQVILRPHPMMRKKFPDFLESLYSEFKNVENFISENNIVPLDSFYESDLMISDWSGVVYEYAFGTEKPVLFIDVPMKVNNPRYKEFKIEPIDRGIRERIGIVVGLDKIGDIDSIIKKLLEERAKYKDEIIKARGEFIYNFGNSSRVGAEYIKDFCTKDVRFL